MGHVLVEFVWHAVLFCRIQRLSAFRPLPAPPRLEQTHAVAGRGADVCGGICRDVRRVQAHDFFARLYGRNVGVVFYLLLAERGIDDHPRLHALQADSDTFRTLATCTGQPYTLWIWRLHDTLFLYRPFGGVDAHARCAHPVADTAGFGCGVRSVVAVGFAGLSVLRAEYAVGAGLRCERAGEDVPI